MHYICGWSNIKEYLLALHLMKSALLFWKLVLPGAMCISQLVADSGKIYAVDTDGKKIYELVTLTPNQDGALVYRVGIIKNIGGYPE